MRSTRTEGEEWVGEQVEGRRRIVDIRLTVIDGALKRTPELGKAIVRVGAGWGWPRPVLSRHLRPGAVGHDVLSLYIEELLLHRHRTSLDFLSRETDISGGS